MTYSMSRGADTLMPFGKAYAIARGRTLRNISRASGVSGGGFLALRYTSERFNSGVPDAKKWGHLRIGPQRNSLRGSASLVGAPRILPWAGSFYLHSVTRLEMSSIPLEALARAPAIMQWGLIMESFGNKMACRTTVGRRLQGAKKAKHTIGIADKPCDFR